MILTSGFPKNHGLASKYELDGGTLVIILLVRRSTSKELSLGRVTEEIYFCGFEVAVRIIE